MMTPGKNRVGSTLVLTASFYDVGGSLADPAALVAKTYNETSSRIASWTYGTDAAVTRAGAGRYELTFTPDEPGRWHIRWEATTENGVIVLEDDFIVQASPFAGSIVDAYRG